MKKSLKKSLALLVALVITSTCFYAFADDLVAINDTTFPDPVFREVVSVNYDANGDGYLNTEERAVTTMTVNGMLEDLRIDETNTVVRADSVIKNLQGIEYFADTLKILRCGDIGLESLDISSLELLTSLSCNGNELTTLDLSHNFNLTDVRCQGNRLTSLDISGLNAIRILYCYTNNLTYLDVSNLISLEQLMCFNNQLESLVTVNNPLLSSLNCSNNHILSLDLSKNTALGIVTDYMIGDQTSTARARIADGKINITFLVDTVSYLTTSSLDTEETKAYTGTGFVVDEVSDIADGIDYTYYVGLSSSEDMRVHLDIIRDFYQVNFYTADDLGERLSYSFVNTGQSAVAPDVPEPPQCKAFSSWSEDITNVTSDLDVYIVWADDHSYALTGFADSIATISCTACQDASYTVDFKTCINAKAGDSNYDEYIDVVDDGIINAKDFAQLNKMF
ncbi:MAG: hypothetical protein ACI4IQ_06145 [Eubacterium sp.]